MKRVSTTSILNQNNKACNGMNESVKIVIPLHYVTPLFISTASERQALNYSKYL